jgi:hypothetical protein
MKYGQKLKHGDAHVNPRNIQEVQASKLGDAQGTPSSSTKISGHLSRHYIFIASYAMCFSWTVMRVNSINILDEGLRIGGKATTRDSRIEIGTRRTQVHVPSVEDRYILLAI